MNSAANFVFTSKIGLPRVVPVLRWVLFVRQIFVAPHLEFEQHMHSSHPRPDTVSLTQLESRGVCPTGFAAPIKSLNQDIFKFNSTTVRPRSEKPLQTSASRNFFFISLVFNNRPGSCQAICGIIIVNKRFSSTKAALTLFVLFALAGIIAAILDVAMLCAVEGAQCKTRELP